MTEPTTEAGHRPLAADNGESYESFQSWTECTCGRGKFVDAEDWFLHARPFIEAEARASQPLTLDVALLRQAFLNAGLHWAIPPKQFQKAVEVVATEYGNLPRLVAKL